MPINFTKADNINPLYSNCFHFEIKSLPHVSGMAQRFNMPGLNLGRAMQTSGNLDFPIPGDKITYEDLEIAFLVDENLENFMEIFHWMMYLGFARDTKQFYELYQGTTRFTETSDILLSVTTNKMNSNRIIHFVDAFPVVLTPVEFSNVDDAATPMTASAMFAYKYYYFEKQDETLDGAIKIG